MHFLKSKIVLSDREIEESVLDNDEKKNVSGYVKDGECSFNTNGGMGSAGAGTGAVAASLIRNGYDDCLYGEDLKMDSKPSDPNPDGSLSEDNGDLIDNSYIRSARVSGDCCSLIGTVYHAKGGDVSNLRIHGDDVDIIIETVDGITELSATFLGDDSYDVEQLDDGANIFSFDEGDVVNGDDIRMPLIKLALEN